ncbi:MAG: hypothetical protein AAF939_12910, partial [Planctomycetota bacterium]
MNKVLTAPAVPTRRSDHKLEKRSGSFVVTFKTMFVLFFLMLGSLVSTPIIAIAYVISSFRPK